MIRRAWMRLVRRETRADVHLYVAILFCVVLIALWAFEKVSS